MTRVAGTKARRDGEFDIGPIPQKPLKPQGRREQSGSLNDPTIVLKSKVPVFA